MRSISAGGCAAAGGARVSQRALAKRVGLPNSTISLIESGRSNPSVGALKRILDGLPIGLAEFFAYQPEAERSFFFKAEDLVEIGRGKISYRQIGERSAGRALQMIREVYQPGADTGKTPLSHQARRSGWCSRAIWRSPWTGSERSSARAMPMRLKASSHTVSATRAAWNAMW